MMHQPRAGHTVSAWWLSIGLRSVTHQAHALGQGTRPLTAASPEAIKTAVPGRWLVFPERGCP